MKRIILSLIFLGSHHLFAQGLNEAIRDLENERFVKAEQSLNTLANGGNAEAAYWLGKLYYKQEKFDLARKSFERGITANAKYPGNYVGMGILALDNGKPEDARKQFDIAFACVSSKDAKVNMMVGEAYSIAQKKDLTQAITYLNKANTLDKKYYDAQIALGDAYLQKIDGGGNAMTAYETAIAYDPTRATGYLRKGDLFFKAKNYELSIESYKTGRDKDSLFAPIHRDLAEIYYQAKRYDLAVKSFEKFLSLTEATPDYKTRMAYFYFFNKNYAKSTEIINQLKKETPENNILNRLLGYGFVEQEKYDDAISYLNEFMKKSDPAKIIASDYEYLGKAYLKAGKDSLAEAPVLKAVEMDSSKYSLLSDLGKSYQDKKNYGKASKFYTERMKYPKASATDWFKLGQTYYFGFQNNKSDSSLLGKADGAFAKVVEFNPNVHLGHFWRARTNSIMDSKLTNLAARPHYEKVIELCSTDKTKFSKELIESYKYLGYSFIQKDDNTAAKLYYEKVLEVNAEDAEAKKILEQLNNPAFNKKK